MTRSQVHKILVTGPVGAGKTSAITAVSDITPVSTEELPSDETLTKKSNTTVAMDYGILKLHDGSKVHIYGTPGQKRFDFMWDILSKGGTGLIILLDNSKESVFEDLKTYVAAFAEFIDTQQLVVGVTRTELKPNSGIKQYHQFLDQLNIRAPVFEVDARSRRDICFLIRALLSSEDAL